MKSDFSGLSSRARLLRVRHLLHEAYGDQRCFLNYGTPVQLLVAAQLSAQCTDELVNRVTPELFALYPDAEAFAAADISELESAIRRVGLFRNKAANIRESCRILLRDFAGEMPSKMDELTSLPGIGRKTANVILGHAFGIPGFPVDTHVIRLMNRLGFVETRNAEKIEKLVNELLPERYWIEFSLLLITHGRARCLARRADCANCEIRKYCQRCGVA